MISLYSYVNLYIIADGFYHILNQGVQLQQTDVVFVTLKLEIMKFIKQYGTTLLDIKHTTAVLGEGHKCNLR